MQDKKHYPAFVTLLPGLITDIYTLTNQAETDCQLIELWPHGRSSHTQRAYRRDIRRFQAFFSNSLAQVTLKDFHGFADSLVCAVSSKRRIIASLKSLFSFAMKIGY